MKKLVYAIVCFSCLFLAGAASSQAQDQGVEFTDLVSGGGPAVDLGRAIARDAMGNTYVAGAFADFADFPPDQIFATGGRDVFILKYDMFGTLLWTIKANDLEGFQNESVSDMAIDELGNVYITGVYNSSSVDFGGVGFVSNVSVSGGNDGYVAKINPDGAFIWAAPFGGPGNEEVWDIEIDKRNQRIYIAGSFEDSCDFSAPTLIRTYSAGGTDAFVARLDYDGNFVWSEQSGGPLDDEARAVSVDQAGIVYTAGNFSSQTQLFAFLTVGNLGGAGQFDAYVAAYQEDALPLWARSFGGAGIDRITAMAIDTFSNNLFLTGAFTNQSNWGANFLNAATPFDTAMFVAKMDDAGNVAWASQNNSGPSVLPFTIALDTTESPVVAGRFSRTATFGCASITEAYSSLGNSTSDLFVAKFDGTDGAIRTVARAGGPDRGDAAFDLYIDDQDVLFMTGYYSDTSDFSDQLLDPYGTVGTDYFAARFEISNSACGVPSDGGRTYSDAAPACIFSLDTVLVSGYTGVFQNWEYSLDGGSSWTTLADPRDYRMINVVPGNRPIFRGVVESCNCPAAPSDSLELPIDALSDGGTIAEDDTVCILGNSGQLNLENSVGDVQQWEQTQDDFETTSILAVTDTFFDYSNVLTRTRYRALVKNGTCPAVYSDTVTLDVSGCEVCGISPTVGGVTTGEDTVCVTGNGGVVKLQSYTGDIVRWELSTDNFRTVTTSTIPVEEFPYANLTETTAFRAVVQSPTCAPAYSSVTVVTIDSCEACGTPPTEIGGTVGDREVCLANNAGFVSVNGLVGDVVRWEYAVNYNPENPEEGLFIPIDTTGGVLPAQEYRNLAQSRWYRAVVRSGLCPAVVSDVIRVKVRACRDCRQPLNLTVTSAGTESATITWDGNNNDLEYIVEYREAGTPVWFQTGSRPERSTYTIVNLDDDTDYEVRVTAVCPDGNSDPSEIATFSTSCSRGGQAQSSNPLVCIGENQVTISVQNISGNVVRWEQSDDGFLTIDVIENPNTSFVVENLSNETSYRALVQRGGCPAVYSQPTTVQVQPCDVCPAPENLLASDLTANTAKIYFVPLDDPDAQYEFSYRPLGSASWTVVDDVLGQPFNLADLNPSTTYRARLRNRCGNGAYSVYSEEITFRTAGGVRNCGTPVVSTVDAQITTAYIEWGSVPGAQFYEVRYRVEGRLTWDTLTTRDRFAFLQNLPPSGRHPFAVRAYCGFDYSGYSNFAFIETEDKPCVTPGAPVAANATTSSVDLSWPVVAHAGQYVFRYRSPVDPDWTEVETDAPNLQLENLAAGSFYEGQVKGVCGANNESAWSPSMVFNTLPCFAPGAPESVRFTTNSAELIWEGATNAQSYIFRYREEGDTEWTETEREELNIRLDGLSPGTFYEAQVRSQCDAVTFSSWSPISAFNTLLPRQAFAETSGEDLRVYPNPSRGAFTVSWRGVSEAPTELLLRGVDGRLVYREMLPAMEGATDHNVRLANYAPGAYLLEIRRGGANAQHVKIILE